MKTGILGLGNIARTMAYAMANIKEASAYAVASRDLQKSQQFAAEYGFEKAYGSYEEMLDDPELELVYIATPHSCHYEQAKLCLEKGKHVLCEKTFTQYAYQAEELFQLAREKHLFIMEAQMVPFMPLAKTLKKITADKVIGEPMNLMAHTSYPMTHKERVMKPELAGGALQDIGIYPIGIANLVFGTQVEKMSSHCILSDTGIDGQFSLNFQYPGGKLATLVCSVYTASNQMGLICGTKGYIQIQDVNKLEAIHVYNNQHQCIGSYKRPEWINQFEYELKASIKAIENGQIQCEEVSHQETLRILGMMDELRKQWGCKMTEPIQ